MLDYSQHTESIPAIWWYSPPKRCFTCKQLLTSGSEEPEPGTPCYFSNSECNSVFVDFRWCIHSDRIYPPRSMIGWTLLNLSGKYISRAYMACSHMACSGEFFSKLPRSNGCRRSFCWHISRLSGLDEMRRLTRERKRRVPHGLSKNMARIGMLHALAVEWQLHCYFKVKEVRDDSTVKRGKNTDTTPPTATIQDLGNNYTAYNIESII